MADASIRVQDNGQAYRAIGPAAGSTIVYIPNVVIEEDHRDELTITEHPVEQGAAISDHAYKRPSEVTLHCGWSNSSPENNGDPFYSARIRSQLLALQYSRKPMDLYTGKQAYKNMLISSLSTKTDVGTEWALLADITFKQVILVATQTTTAPTDPTVQKEPQLTAPPKQQGPQSLSPAPGFNPSDYQITDPKTGIGLLNLNQHNLGTPAPPAFHGGPL